MKRQMILLMTALIISGCTIYIPGFNGYVVDKQSGRPLSNAMVISFSDYYKPTELINVGGGNPTLDSIEYTRTNENGYFEVDPYFRVFGEVEKRVIFYIDNKYAFAGRYYQLAEKKHILSQCFQGYRFCNDINLKNTTDVLFRISNEPDIDWEGETIVNPVKGLINMLNNYIDSNGCNHRNEYLYTEIYRIISENKKAYSKQFDARQLASWDESMDTYKKNIDNCFGHGK